MATETKLDIKQVRESIDTIDNQILSLLKERLAYAKNIGALKDETNRAKWDPLRERQIYDRLTELNKGVFPENHPLWHRNRPESAAGLEVFRNGVEYVRKNL